MTELKDPMLSSDPDGDDSGESGSAGGENLSKSLGPTNEEMFETQVEEFFHTLDWNNRRKKKKDEERIGGIDVDGP